MIRVGTVALAWGLIILWIFGLTTDATTWLTWLDGVAGLLVLVFGGTFFQRGGIRRSILGLLAVAVALALLFGVGLWTNASAWLAWWTLALALSFAALAAAEAALRIVEMRRTPRLV